MVLGGSSSGKLSPLIMFGGLMLKLSYVLIIEREPP